MELTRRQIIKLFGGTMLSAHFGLKADEGKPLDLSKYKGKVVLVDFWASWCVPCKKSFPWLNDMSGKYSKFGLVVVGVNVDEKKPDADIFLREHPAEFPVIFDSSGAHASYYDIQGMPSSLLFSKSGEIVHRHVGFVSDQENEYESALVKALKG